MFLRATIRKKDGKEHRYWSVVATRRVARGRVIQRHVLYLGEINSSQELAWRKSIEVLDEGVRGPRSLALFAEDRCEGLVPHESIVRLRLSQLRVCRPRQWGACWLALRLWQELRCDEFWAERLPPSRKGTPKGRLNRLEQALLAKPWRQARPGVQVKLLPEDGELYVFAQSADRIAKERSMRQRQLKWLWARLGQLSAMRLARDALLMKLGSAQTKAPAAWRLIDIHVPEHGGRFTYQLDRDKLRKARRREGRYLLRTNLTESDPVKLWNYLLPAAGQSRSGVPNLEGRSGDPTNLPPGRSTH